MLKKIFATLTASAVVITAAPINAQSDNGQRYFFRNFLDEPPDCEKFYPEPIGTLPSRMAEDQICLPPPLTIIPKYGRNYARLMRIAIKAGIKGDYDTALINFRRAHLIEISKNHLGYSNREALRGINAAVVAKRYQRHPDPNNNKFTPEFFWYHWTGTGERGNWGGILPEK